MAHPKISVIMAAYNHERFVLEALNSVLEQTFGDLELVVIDDGSSDNTGEVVKLCRDKDSRIIYIHQENQDAYNALNRGLRTASGEYIAILNSDDLYAGNRLARMLDEQRATGAACLFTDVQPIDEHGNEIIHPDFFWNAWHRANREFYFSCGDLYTAFLNGNFLVGTSNLFMTREAAQKVGFFSAFRYLHDYDYIFRLMLAYPQGVRYLSNEKLLFYRLHGRNTLSQGAVLAREQDQQIIWEYMMSRMPPELRAIAATGSCRLMTLEQELMVERQRARDTHLCPAQSRMLAVSRSILASLRSIRQALR